ncbi:MAG TPA: N-(5'-phosphoribosyl)anthranilate isomerase [Spirochaetia bacterium]|nr:N-(5'-phosphoribosyl)anthranilate isomerase [Spirochaetia bacterium]
MMPKVKICGITNLEDALLSASLGADALGFIFYSQSPRSVLPEKAKEIIEKLPPFILKVGVFVEESLETILRMKELCFLDRIQIHSENNEILKSFPPAITYRAYRVKDQFEIEKINASSFFPLLDSYKEGLYGGTGKSFNWELLQKVKRPYILAGGINPDTIGEALKLNPYGIDIASGVEAFPGKKDPEKLKMVFKHFNR